MSKLSSGKIKVVSPTVANNITSRYEFLSLDLAEPNLGVPPSTVGVNFFLASQSTGNRYWSSEGGQGTTGSQGGVGTQGAFGVQGTQGAGGTSVRIIGSVADVNVNPPNNPQTTLNNAFPGKITGDGVIDELTGNLWIYDGSAWVNVGNIRGPQGPTGPQGPKGDQGIQGVGGIATQGAVGLQGSQGLIGIQGAGGTVQGTTGAQGVIGIQGSQGLLGLQGSQGLFGTQGLIGIQGTGGTAQGADGTQGVIGPQGIQGPRGFTGLQGFSGVQGTGGTSGSDGDKGDKGDQGIQGPAGSQGTNGTQGVGGSQGIAGVTATSLTASADAGTNYLVGVGAVGSSQTPKACTSVYMSASTVYASDFSASSDRRLKKNIENLENALELLKQINGVKYEWVDSNMGSGTQIGVIAQDVEKVLPEVVTHKNNGYKTVSYDRLIPLIIEAIKELAKKQ